ncbi:MAG: hypothetical protein ACREUG_12095 [Steroidobacteraceae bacterium]
MRTHSARTTVVLACCALLACLALAALPGLAQAATGAAAAHNPFRGMTPFAGTVERVDGHEFLIKGRGGTTATYELGRSVRIMTSRPGTAADLASGRFVGCTAVKGRDGKLYATECHLFPESMRGVGEGHNPMGPPNTTMTNGDITTETHGKVETASGSADGTLLHVTYKGGAQNIEVTPQTHITVIGQGARSLVKPGAKVMGAARKAADGTEIVQMLNIAP